MQDLYFRSIQFLLAPTTIVASADSSLQDGPSLAMASVTDTYNNCLKRSRRLQMHPRLHEAVESCMHDTLVGRPLHSPRLIHHLQKDLYRMLEVRKRSPSHANRTFTKPMGSLRLERVLSRPCTLHFSTEALST